MRRAISCVYCAPKSRIRILSVWMECMQGFGIRGWGFGQAGRGGWMVVGIRRLSERRQRKRTAFPNPQSRIPAPSVEPIVRRFLRDRDVMHMRLSVTHRGDAHELRP